MAPRPVMVHHSDRISRANIPNSSEDHTDSSSVTPTNGNPSRSNNPSKTSGRSGDAHEEISSIIGQVFSEHRACMDQNSPIRSQPRLTNIMNKQKIKVRALSDVKNQVEQEKRKRLLQQEREDRIDLFLYVLFMIIFTLNTCDGLGDSSYYRFNAALDATMGLSDFSSITEESALNTWLETNLVDNLYSTNFEGCGSLNSAFNPEAANLEEDLTAANGWLVQGPVRIAQLRSKIFDCRDSVPESMQQFPFRCTRSRDLTFTGSRFLLAYEDKKDYRNFTYDIPDRVEKVAYQREHVRYSTYTTRQGHTFPAPGFPILINPHDSRTTAQGQVDQLVSNKYIDRSTNVLFIDMSVYNYMLETTAWVRLTAEFNSAGGVDCGTDLQVFQLLWNPNRKTYKIFLYVAVGLGYCYLTAVLCRKIYLNGYAQFESFYTYVQIMNIGFYFVNMAFRYQSYSLLVDGLLASTSIGKVDYTTETFLDFRPPITAMRYAITFQSINTFLNWFKLVNFLAVNPTFGLMTQTLYNAASEMRAFVIVFMVVMFGFAQAHAMFFGASLSSYRTILVSLYTLFRAMLGDFNFEEMYNVDVYIGPVFFICFVGIAFLVVLNIIIAIIADAYLEADSQRKIKLEERKKMLEERQKTLKFKRGVKGVFQRARNLSLQAGRRASIAEKINAAWGGTSKGGPNYQPPKASWPFAGKGPKRWKRVTIGSKQSNWRQKGTSNRSRQTHPLDAAVDE